MNPELKDKIQALINHKEKQSKYFLNVFIWQIEEIGTLKRLRDFEKDEEVLLTILGWLSIKRNDHQLTSTIKENLSATLEKEVALIEKSNLLAQYLTKEELLQEIRKRVDQGEMDWNEVIN